MSYQTILLDQNEGVATITLNRPDKLNAFSQLMIEELLDLWSVMDADPDCRVVVMTGAGRAFSAGGDMQWFQDSIDARLNNTGDQRVVGGKLYNACMLLRNLTKPTIAALNGTTLGMGLTMALACDIRIAAEEARLGAIFPRMGVIPEFGSTYTLPRLVGIAKACELVLTSKIVDAREAKEIGLVNQVFPGAGLAEAAKSMARSIAQLPPLVIQLAKRLMYQGLDNDFPTQAQSEVLGLEFCFRTEDHAEAVKAFMEKRSPVFIGR